MLRAGPVGPVDPGDRPSVRRTGERAYGEKHAQAIEATGLEYNTLNNVRWVAERVEGRLHPLIPRETPRWHKLYKGRASVEREFGRLKHDWALAPLRVRGLDRVRLHADLTILAKLACALARAEAVPLAA